MIVTTEIFVRADPDVISAELTASEIEVEFAALVHDLPTSDIERMEASGFEAFANRRKAEMKLAGQLERMSIVVPECTGKELAFLRKRLPVSKKINNYVGVQPDQDILDAIDSVKKLSNADTKLTFQIWYAKRQPKKLSIGPLVIAYFIDDNLDKHYYPIARWAPELITLTSAQRRQQVWNVTRTVFVLSVIALIIMGGIFISSRGGSGNTSQSIQEPLPATVTVSVTPQPTVTQSVSHSTKSVSSAKKVDTIGPSPVLVKDVNHLLLMLFPIIILMMFLYCFIRVLGSM